MSNLRHQQYDYFKENVTLDEVDTIDNYNHASIYLMLTFSMLFIFVGFPGNIVTLCVLNRRSLKDNDISLYLKAIGLLNMLDICIFMVIHLPSLLRSKRIEYFSPGVCTFTFWSTSCLLAMKTWLLIPANISRMLHYKRWPALFSTMQPYLTISVVLVFGAGIFALIAIRRVVYYFDPMTRKYLGCWQNGEQYWLFAEVSITVIAPLVMQAGIYVYARVMPAKDVPRRSSQIQKTLLVVTGPLALLVLLTNCCVLLPLVPTTIGYLMILSSTYHSAMGQAKSLFGLNMLLLASRSHVVTLFAVFYWFEPTFRGECKNFLMNGNQIPEKPVVKSVVANESNLQESLVNLFEDPSDIGSAGFEPLPDHNSITSGQIRNIFTDDDGPLRVSLVKRGTIQTV